MASERGKGESSKGVYLVFSQQFVDGKSYITIEDMKSDPHLMWPVSRSIRDDGTRAFFMTKLEIVGGDDPGVILPALGAESGDHFTTDSVGRIGNVTIKDFGDVDDTDPIDGEALIWVTAIGAWKPGGAGGGVDPPLGSTFVALTDTPAAYASNFYSELRVNLTESAVEFFIPYWQGSVKDKDLTAPPGSPASGDRYIVAASASGAWATEDNNIATWDGTEWKFTTSVEGFTCWVDDEDLIYTFDGSTWSQLTGGAGTTTFTGLTDTPANYTGQALKGVRVNAGETALEFTALASATTFAGLTDTPANYVGAATKLVAVNAGATALEFITNTITTTFVGLSDTPANYTGQTLKGVRVNAGETALEFYTIAAGISTFAGLTDTPANYVGAATKLVAVNAGETALEFTTSASAYVYASDAETGGTDNVFVDESPARAGNTGDYNVFVGHGAGLNNVGYNACTYIGYQAGYTNNQNSGLSHCTLVGYKAGRETSAVSSTCIGAEAGLTLTSGPNNTFIGAQCGKLATSGYENTFVGSTAGWNLTEGHNNTFIGDGTGFSAITGDYNTALGSEAGRAAVLGDNNVLIGFQAGYGVAANSYSENVIIGTEAGFSLTTGSGNVLIGYQAGYNLTTESNTLYIANSNTATPLIYGEFDTGFITINGDFNVIGTTQLGDGGTTNYAKFEPDGELALYGTARVKKAIDMAGATFEFGSSAPTASAVGNYLVWIYTVGDDSVLTFELPPDWASGTDLTIKVDWGIDRAYGDENAEIQWNVSWSATPHDASAALDAASTTLDPGDQNIPAIAKALAQTTMGTISGGSLSVEDEIGLKIERVAIDGGNDPGGAKHPFITHLYIEYIADKLGKAT